MNKLIKRILASSIVICSLLQLGVVPYASAEVEAKGNAEYEIMLLNKLGFIDEVNGPKTGDEFVSRGQFASMLAYLRGLDEQALSKKGKFIDVPTDYWCAGQINALYNIGVINGTDPDIFSPNDFITYPQVIKCLVSVLGYDVQAARMGGYPNGYSACASQIGLNVASVQGEAVNFATVAKLMVKAMDTSVMELTLTTDDSVSFVTQEDQTPLKKYNDIYYGTGIMTDNGTSTLTGNSRMSKGWVNINGTVMDSSDCEVEQYLGYNLKYYYKRFDDDDYKLLFVIPYKTNTQVLTDNDLDVEAADYGTKRIYNLFDRGRNYYKLDAYVDVIYNGVAYPAFDADTLKIDQGSLTLIDNDDDGDYEVVFVDEYYNIYTSGVDIDNDVIYGKFGEYLDYGQFDDVVFKTNDGGQTKVETVALKQVLSVFESLDKSLLTIVINTGGISGRVESIEDYVAKSSTMTDDEKEVFRKEAREMKYFIGEDDEAELSSDYINAVLKGYQGAVLPENGMAYIFHLDINGKIAGIEDPTGIQYAYLINVYFNDFEGEAEGVSMAKLFMQDETLLKTSFAKNVKVDGIMFKGQIESADGVYNYSKFRDPNTAEFIRQPVKVRLNSIGEITEMETATKNTSSYGYDKTKFTLCLDNNSEYGGSNQRSFKEGDKIYTLANDIVIFNVPPDSEFVESELEVMKMSQLTEGSNYPVKLYDADASWNCKMAVIQAGESTDWYLGACLVEKIQTAMVDEDTVAKVVTGLDSVNWVTYIENKPGVFPAELAPGDIVRVVRGVNNKVLRMEILASGKRDANNPFYDSLDGDDWSSYFGQLYARSDASFTLTLDHGASVVGMPFNDSIGTVNVFDMKTKRARRGSKSDMVMNCPIMDDGTIDLTNSNSMIYVYKRRGYARAIIVIKYE